MLPFNCRCSDRFFLFLNTVLKITATFFFYFAFSINFFNYIFIQLVRTTINNTCTNEMFIRNSRLTHKSSAKESARSLLNRINLVSDSVPINLAHMRLCCVTSIHLRLLHATPVVMLDWLERFWWSPPWLVSCGFRLIGATGFFVLQKSQTKGEGYGNHGGSEIVPGGGRPREAATGVGPEDAGGPTARPGLQRMAGVAHSRTVRPH